MPVVSGSGVVVRGATQSGLVMLESVWVSVPASAGVPVTGVVARTSCPPSTTSSQRRRHGWKELTRQARNGGASDFGVFPSRQPIGGRSWRQGRARSNAADARSTSSSAKRRPTICNPIGRRSFVKPHGMEAAG